MTPISKEDEGKILAYCNRQFRKHLKIPSPQQIKKYFQTKNKNYSLDVIKRVRNKLQLITKFHPLGDTGKHRGHMFSVLRVTTLGWVEVDLMFLHIHKNRYGQAFVAIDILSKRVYVQSIKDKTIESIQNAIANLIKAPGFRSTKCILSDNEPAIRGLANRKTFKNIRFVTTDKKAKTVERAIRTIKVLLTKYMIQQGETNLTKWRDYIDTIVLHMNTRRLPGKIPGESDIVRPLDLNMRNVGKYVEYLLFNNRIFFQSLHPFLIPEKSPERVFKFNVGDVVYLAKKLEKKKIQENYKFETRSLGGHFAKYTPNKMKNDFIITSRRLETSSLGHIIPVYDIKQDDLVVYHVYEEYLRDYPDEKKGFNI